MLQKISQKSLYGGKTYIREKMQNFVKIKEIYDNERARFLRIRKGDEEKQIIIDFFNGNKRSSIMFTLIAKIDSPGFHNCKECAYNGPDIKCRGMCTALEVTDQIREFIERELGLNPLQYYLTPILHKK